MQPFIGRAAAAVFLLMACDRAQSGARATQTAASIATGEGTTLRGPVLVFDEKERDPQVMKDAIEFRQRTGAAVDTKRVLDAVFGGRYLLDPKECKDAFGERFRECYKVTSGDVVGACDWARLFGNAREAGDIVPHVAQIARGSFTMPHVVQTLFTISVGECGTPLPATMFRHRWGSSVLAVMQDGKLVAQAPLVNEGIVHRVVDIDGDGVDEVVVVGGYGGQGHDLTTARVVRFDANRGGLVEVHDLGVVGRTDCPASPDSSGVTKTRVTFAQGMFDKNTSHHDCPAE